MLKNEVEIFKALSDENRITIFKLLRHEELCVCDILENLELSQPTVSHHLKVLYQADLIQAEKRGKWKYYSINDEKVIETKQFFDMILNRELDAEIKGETEQFFEMVLNKELDAEIKHADSDCDGTR